MTTKYAKARDAALQWRAEFRKAKQENKSLLKVLEASRQLTEFLGKTRVCLDDADTPAFDELVKRLAAAQRSAAAAVGRQSPSTPVAPRKGQKTSNQSAGGSAASSPCAEEHSK